MSATDWLKDGAPEVGPAAYDHSGTPPTNPGETLIGVWEPMASLDTPEERASGKHAIITIPTVGFVPLLEASTRAGLRMLGEAVYLDKHNIGKVGPDARYDTSVAGTQPEVTVAPDMYHMISQGHIVRLADGYEAVRCRVLVGTNEHAPTPWVTWCDFPQHTLGILVESARVVAAGQRAIKPSYVTAKSPRWVGSHSFEPLLARCDEVVRDLYRHRNTEVSPRAVLYDSLRSLLDDAHVVCVDPEQVSVLPDWESWSNLTDYAVEAWLPFDPVYLDFEGPGGIAPHVESAEGIYIALRGAMVWTEPETPGALLVAPVASHWKDETSGRGYNLGGFVALGASKLAAQGWNEATISPRNRPDLTAQAPVYALSDAVDDPDALGVITLPFDVDDPNNYRQVIGTDKDAMVLTANMVAILAAKVVAALSILEAQEVEIVDAPVHKRDVKRAEKRGWEIAKAVHVRSTSKRYLDSNSTGEEAHYSHRFWVRGHTKHFPVGTQTADARPDLCKPCVRCGACRRVKSPPHIKGPPDKPLIVKSLVTHAGKQKDHYGDA